MGKGIDECRARGCGGWLGGVGTEVHDGEIACCRVCGREHTFYVAIDGRAGVAIERKRRLGAKDVARIARVENG
jgi:hypothetical protein